MDFRARKLTSPVKLSPTAFHKFEELPSLSNATSHPHGMSYFGNSLVGVMDGGARLSVAEISAMRLDGEVYRLAELTFPTDSPATPSLKALSVCHTEPHKLVATGNSALWIHGLTHEPTRHEVTFIGHTRPIDLTERLRDIREIKIDTSDLAVLLPHPPGLPIDQLHMHGMVVTAERAIADLARECDGDDADVVESLVTLITRGKCDVSLISSTIEKARRMPHRKRGLRRIVLVRQRLSD